MPETAKKKMLEDTYVYMDQIEWYERLDHPFTNRLIFRVAAGSDSFKECVKHGKERYDEDKQIEKVRKLGDRRRRKFLRSLLSHAGIGQHLASFANVGLDGTG